MSADLIARLRGVLEAWSGFTHSTISSDLLREAASALEAAEARIASVRAESVEEWQPIETAPKDGTVADLWHDEFGRQADCYWGKPDHRCGENEQYCDSDWHGEPDAWIDATLNGALFGADEFTHWRPLPPAPKQEGA